MVCAGCTFNNVSESSAVDWDDVITILKPLSPECRKVYLVGVPFTHAYDYMKKGEDGKALLALCVAYTSYQMDYAEINAMSESLNGDKLSKKMSDMANRCADLTQDKGKEAWEYASLADDKLTPYMQKHYDECLNLKK